METKNPGEVKHPGREAWMGWLYGEHTGEAKTALAAHLETCAVCQSEVNQWRGTMQTLDQYELPRHRAPARLSRPLLKWAAAAAIVLCAGFGLGRLMSPTATASAAYRASLKSEIRAELLADLKQQQQQILENYTKTAEETRNAENKVMLSAIARLEADRVADYAALRKDLETMAVLTEDTFRKEHDQLVTLASFAQTEINPPNH